MLPLIIKKIYKYVYNNKTCLHRFYIKIIFHSHYVPFKCMDISSETDILKTSVKKSNLQKSQLILSYDRFTIFVSIYFTNLRIKHETNVDFIQKDVFVYLRRLQIEKNVWKKLWHVVFEMIDSFKQRRMWLVYELVRLLGNFDVHFSGFNSSLLRLQRLCENLRCKKIEWHPNRLWKIIYWGTPGTRYIDGQN